MTQPKAPNQYHPSPRCDCIDCRCEFPPPGTKPMTRQERFDRAFAEVFGTRTLPDFTPRPGQGPGHGAKHRGRR